MKKLPVILITGFLGAGKTTFLNKLLTYMKSEGKSVALLINEFGRTNIDKDLIDSKGEMIYEVNQGSIFCVCTRDQFIKALDSITTHSPTYDVAIIESTGIANTRDIGKYLNEAPLAGKLDIKQNFCLVDAVNFHKVFETLPAVKTQVEEASICVLNKSDMVKEQRLTELEEQLIELNPDAPVIRSEYGDIGFEASLDFSSSWATRTELDQAPPDNIVSVTLTAEGLMSLDKASAFLNTYNDSLLRAKGFLYTNKGPIYIEWVGNRLFTRPGETGSDDVTRLVLIGYMLNEESIKDKFKNCIV